MEVVMNTNKKLKNARSGTAIITVLGLVALISMASGYMAYTASQEMHMSQVLRESLKAKLIAESGLNTAYQLLKTDFSKAPGLKLENTFGDGNYVVTSAPDPASAFRFQLTSHGTCGKYGKYKVGADIENRQRITSLDPNDRFFKLLYDFLVLSSMYLNGNILDASATIHANGNIKLGGSSSIPSDAKISSTGTIDDGKLNLPASSMQENAQPVTLPEGFSAAIDELIAFARQNGEVYKDGEAPSSAPQGGVAICEGFPPSNWTGGTGCYIFLGGGKIVLNNLTINNVDGYPSLVFKNTAEISLTGNVVLNGAVLLPSSSLKFTGNAAVYGPLVVGLPVDGNGTADHYAGPIGQGFNLPPIITDNVIISAWH
jgi:hypothetical protein